MTIYASQAVVPLGASAQALYDDVIGQSSHHGERLTLLGQRAKLGALPHDVEAVRQRLWVEFDPGPPRPYTSDREASAAHAGRELPPPPEPSAARSRSKRRKDAR